MILIIIIVFSKCLWLFHHTWEIHFLLQTISRHALNIKLCNGDVTVLITGKQSRIKKGFIGTIIQFLGLELHLPSVLPMKKRTGGALLETKPLYNDIFKTDQTVWAKIVKGGLKPFTDACKGFDENISKVVASSWKEKMVEVGDVKFSITPQIIATAIFLPAAGRIIDMTKKKQADGTDDFKIFVDKGSGSVM